MIDLHFHAEKMYQGLVLHRFHIHRNEVERVLQPILDDVYRIGYDRGFADRSNNLSLNDPEPIPMGTIVAQVELIHHEPEPEPAICPFTTKTNDE